MYVVLTALVIGYVVVDSLGYDATWLDGWGVVAFEIVAGALCVLKAAYLRRGRAVPILLGIGSGVLGRGRSHPHDPVARRGDAPVALAAPTSSTSRSIPVTYAALMLLLRGNVRRFSLAGWLDGAVAGFGAAAVCATFAFDMVLHHAGGSRAGVAVNLAYPVGDVLLLGLVVGGAAIVPGKRKIPWLLLAAGYALNTVGDVFNVLGTTSMVGTVFNDIAWPRGDPARVDRGLGRGRLTTSLCSPKSHTGSRCPRWRRARRS